MATTVRFSNEAEEDLQGLLTYVSAHAGVTIAKSFIEDIVTYCESFSTFPQRGRLPHDIRPGLRIVGFRRRVSVAFVAGADEVVVLGILYAGLDPARELKIDAPEPPKPLA